MATLAAAPTVFQSAAAALTPANASVTRDAQEIYRIAIQNVRRMPKHQSLTQNLVDRITNARTIEELAKVAGTEISRDRSLRAAAFWKQVGGIVNTFGQFRTTFDLYAQAGPGSVVLPIYASVCLIAQIAADVLNTYDGLQSYHERISYFHKQYTEYVLGQDFKTPLRDALTRFYEANIEFCLEAFSLLSENSKGEEDPIPAQKTYRPFDNFLKELEQVRADVDSAVLGEVFHDHKITKRTLAQPKRAGFSPTPVTARSNYRHICVPGLFSQHFTGRSSDLHLIHRYFATVSSLGPARAALWGDPGMGKTQLTLQYLQRYSYSCNIFVNASSKSSIISTYRTVASTLELLDTALASDDQVVEKVKSWLGAVDNWLLIFDNIKDAKDVFQFTPSTGQGHILFTTRTKLTATTLAISEGCIELKRLSQEEAKELALRIACGGRPYSAQDVLAASAVADFTAGLPLAVEQLARLSQLKAFSLHDTLELVGRRANLLRLEHPASMHERNLSCGALLLETLEEVRRTSEGAAALFVLISYFEPSRIPLQIIFDGPPEIAAFFARQDTYIRGAIKNHTKGSSRSAPKRKFRLDDYEPFELATYKKLLRLGQHDRLYADARLPRVDSDEDRQLQDYWNSYKPLKAVFLDKTTINHSLNLLTEAGLMRRLYDDNSLWIHDLYAEMTTAIDQENGTLHSNTTAYLATTMVYLSFPIPQIPAPFRILDHCILLLPSALRCQDFLLKAGTLSNTTTGAELSHLIASTIHARGMMIAELRPESVSDAIKHYKLALQGYVRAYNRLKIHPSITPLKIILATVSDQSEEDLHHQYLFTSYLIGYQRFGRSAPWRALQTALKIGDLLMAAGKLDESLSFVNIGVEISKEIFGLSHPETIDAMGILLQVREARREWYLAYDVALRRAKAFMGFHERTDEPPTMGLIDTIRGATLATDLGKLSQRLGKVREAEHWYEYAAIALNYCYGHNSPEAEAGRKRAADLHSHDRS